MNRDGAADISFSDIHIDGLVDDDHVASAVTYEWRRRLDGEVARNGMGIGHCRMIIERHGRQISASSDAISAVFQIHFAGEAGPGPGDALRAHLPAVGQRQVSFGRMSDHQSAVFYVP